tara:strand:+ start:288 stop:659 length:372 start_codon:yes stop_codon:yes gene_type:complete
MSKIVTAVNAMISNPDLITNAIQGSMDGECFFKYDKKHLWSIIDSENGEYSLHYYPGNQNLEALASIPEEMWHQENINSVPYNTKTLGTKEAKDSFKELNTIIKEKVYGMDDVLDDIIGKGQF